MAEISVSSILEAVALDHFERYTGWKRNPWDRGEEGRESHPHTSFLLVYNQQTDDPYEILRRDALDLINTEPYNGMTVESCEDILKYLSECGDGACAINTACNEIAHVDEINNRPAGLPPDFDVYSLIPNDFVYYKGNSYRPGQIGTKTKAAFKAAAAADKKGYDDFYAIITRETPYANPWVGMAALIGVDGLKEMYYLLSLEDEPNIPTHIRHRIYGRDGSILDKPASININKTQEPESIHPAQQYPLTCLI